MDADGTDRMDDELLQNSEVRDEAEGDDEVMEEEVQTAGSSLAQKAALNAQKRKLGNFSKPHPLKARKVSVSDALQQQIEDLVAEQQKQGKVQEAQGKEIEGVKKELKKYTLKVEGLPPTVKNAFEFLEELYANGFKMTRKIVEADFRDYRLVPINNGKQKGKQILLLEFASFDLKMKTLKCCNNLAQYLFEGNHKLSVKDEKTAKDRKREFLAILTRKLFEVVSKDHPTILQTGKKGPEKIKIVRTDCLTSQYRAPKRWDDWVSEVHKLEVHSDEAKSILAKITKTNNELKLL